MLEAFFDGVLAGYGIAIPVGAIAVLIVTTAMRCGFACGASAGAGAATADLIYATIAVVGGGTVAALVEPWAQEIRVLSAMVLVFIALIGLWRARRPLAASSGDVVFRRGELALTHGRFLGLTIINPLTVFYFGVMVMGTSAGRGRMLTEGFVFVAGAFLASFSWQLLLAAFGAGANRALSPRFRVLTAMIGNVIILGLAARILL